MDFHVPKIINTIVPVDALTQRDFIASEEARETLIVALEFLQAAVSATPLFNWPWATKHLVLMYDGLTKLTLTVSYKLFANHKSGAVGSSDKEFVTDLDYCLAILAQQKIAEAKVIMAKWESDGELFTHLSAYLWVPCFWLTAKVLNPSGGSMVLVDRESIISERESLAECLARIIPLLSTGPLNSKQKAMVMKTLIALHKKLEQIYR